LLKRNDRASSARRVDSSRLAHIVTSDVAGSFSVTMATRSVLSGGLAWRALFADQRKDHHEIIEETLASPEKLIRPSG